MSKYDELTAGEMMLKISKKLATALGPNYGVTASYSQCEIYIRQFITNEEFRITVEKTQ